MVCYHDLYYFLYPPHSVAALAVDCRQRLRRQDGAGKPMPPERLHVTLHPLGRFVNRIQEEPLKLALAVGSAMDEASFDIAFDQVRSHAGGGDIGGMELVGRGPVMREVRRFQRRLGEEMLRLGFPADRVRTRFFPHMTLDYAPGPVEGQTITPIAWRVTQLYLVDSLYGQSRHEVLACWSLTQRQRTFSDW